MTRLAMIKQHTQGVLLPDDLIEHSDPKTHADIDDEQVCRGNAAEASAAIRKQQDTAYTVQHAACDPLERSN